MKKLQVSLLLVFLASFSAFANDSDLFKFDYNAVQTEFTQLNQLGDMVTANADLTFSVLKLTNENLVNSLKLVSEGTLPGAAAGEPVAGIPSFLWGCVLGPVGLAIVYIGTEKDKVETRKAMWGCITSVGVEVVVYVIYWAAVLRVVHTTI
jgi:hypothetical protein